MKNIKFLSIAFVAALGLASCNKALDLQPTDNFTEDNAFQNLGHLQLGTNESYGRYLTYANDMYLNALLADEAKLGDQNAGQGALTYRYQFSADGTTGGDVVGGWGGYYSVIDQTNRVLAAIERVNVLPSEQARENVLKGQNLALRAISHFGLLQTFCGNFNANDRLGVPIMLASDVSAKPARATMGQVMTQIENDLSTAKTLLASQPFYDTVMNKYNIAAYQARIALYKKDYAAAANYATEVISSMVKPLASITEFPDIWIDNGDMETLFRIRTEVSTAIGGLWQTTNDYSYIAPSDKLTNTYSGSDVREATYIGTSSLGSRIVKKFYTSSRGGLMVDAKPCRIAEMYLIRAEANARKVNPDLTAATADLNLLRQNRINGYLDQTYTDASDLIDAIMLERFKELAFEGFRFYDLKRNNLPVERLASDANAAWQTLPAGNFRFVMPIPQDELLANPNMEQNPGY
jgi:hypothetical protein